MKVNKTELYTPEGKALVGTPWEEYPRPQLRRDSYLCLNGEWELSFDGKQTKVRVPFVPQSMLSGVELPIPDDAELCYRRSFTLPEGFLRDRLLLHFGAVDQIARVYLNGRFVGEHRGGYLPFTFDITPLLKDQNELTVLVTDELDTAILPYGKQCKKRGGMWYTAVSGIWQTVWLESVPETYVRDLKIDTEVTPSVATVTVCVGGVDDGSLTVHTPHGPETVPLAEGKATIVLSEPTLWSPEEPYLYTFELEAGKDTVTSYFALRTLDIREIKGKKRLCLNGKPYFFHALLDQGYFSDGIFTPASPEGFYRDIREMKKLGFNTLRKHIKIEPEIFYYACDRIGMIVFQDMVNNGRYSFLRDTALPTIGMKRLNDRFLHRHKPTREAFEEAMKETVKHLYNHPSVCYYTIFNEGWGQFDSERMFRSLKELDSSRFIDTASGWFEGADSDVVSMHVYFKPVKMPKKAIRPVVLSEFGGYSYKPKGHIYNTEKTYGYKFFEKQEDFETALLDLYYKEVLPCVEEGLCAAVYTQVSDVEDETNGLLSYDRCVLKVSTEKMLAVAEALKAAIEE